MSVVFQHELALHLGSFKNISMRQQGNYCLRFHLYHRDKQGTKLALPATVIGGEPKSPKGRGARTVDQCYITQHIPIRYEQQVVNLDETCTFRSMIDSSVLDEQGNCTLTLFCQLMISEPFIDEDHYRKCAEFTADIRSLDVLEYLDIMFEDRFYCIISGAVVSTVYKAQFNSNEEKVLRQRELKKEQMEKYHIQNIKELKKEEIVFRTIQEFSNHPKMGPQAHNLFEYCADLVKQKGTKLQNTYKKYIQMLASGLPEKKIQTVKEEQAAQSNAKSSQNIILAQRLSEEDRQMYLGCLQEEKERKKIFNTAPHRKFQEKMHKAANRIYIIWGNFLRLFRRLWASTGLCSQLQREYKQKIHEKWGESFVKVEIKAVDWSVEKYANTGEEHATMSKKLRSPQFMTIQQQSRLQLVDRSMFDKPQTRTIMFQQIYIRPETPSSLKMQPYQKPTGGRHLFVLVHGLGACRYDMDKLSVEIKRINPGADVLISLSNECKTEGDIGQMGERLSKQVINHLGYGDRNIDRISFVGHSMGGVIIRTALPKLENLKDLFHTFISLSSPHVGYAYNPSKLIDLGLWIINNVQKSLSILQLSMQDAPKIEDTFLYKLSQEKGFQWFRKVVLFSSYQDAYIPYQSARIMKTPQNLTDIKNGVNKGIRYAEMVDSLLNRIQTNKLHRVDVNFQIQGQNIDNFIGRSAHIKFLNCRELLRMIAVTCEHIFI